jgi:hypothetical protein
VVFGGIYLLELLQSKVIIHIWTPYVKETNAHH